MQSHPNAKGLRNKSFPYYDDLACVFGKDRATGARAGTLGDMASNLPDHVDDEVIGDVSQEYNNPIPPFSDPMSQDDGEGTPTSRNVRVRTGSKGSKRKRSTVNAEVSEVVREAMEYHTNQLKVIAEWPKEKRATEVELRERVVTELMHISELQNRERVKLMNILFADVQKTESFLSVPAEMKLEYCELLLEDHP